jgi:hypothetical protein
MSLFSSYGNNTLDLTLRIINVYLFMDFACVDIRRVNPSQASYKVVPSIILGDSHPLCSMLAFTFDRL